MTRIPASTSDTSQATRTSLGAWNGAGGIEARQRSFFEHLAAASEETKRMPARAPAAREAHPRTCAGYAWGRRCKAIESMCVWVMMMMANHQHQLRALKMGPAYYFPPMYIPLARFTQEGQERRGKKVRRDSLAAPTKFILAPLERPKVSPKSRSHKPLFVGPLNLPSF